ncbi:uncharacterized protein KY384_002943 [Bacidia gigantensis]|uniref:uncharacterized protein n=1 Tax=Bacidia gigantensis TaxID=2732470 RepID=UPI001D03C86E|nr:uncharacterized protein KY384_002943 [Bacidia gigantensis]KAG8531314.1 hypothetical protein KY384_002943 [Bacidia gigantensis]
MHIFLPLPLLLLSTAQAALLPRQTASQTTSSASASPTACNNHASLCSRSYSNITHLGAHDSPFLRNSSSNSGFGLSDAGNQNIDSLAQLSAGVRLLSAQIHKSDNALHLCHTSCSLLDAGLLRDWLSSIKGWLDSHTSDVVTLVLVNSDNVAATDLASEFVASGISTYGYTPSTAGQWPTLQAMISANTRLVTFVASLPQSSGYLLNEFDYLFENPYNNTAASSFTCAADRPVAQPASAAIATGKLPLLNHFLYQTMTLGSTVIESPDTASIGTTNAATGTGSLGDFAAACAKDYGGKAPWGLLVDYFDQGDTLKVVDDLNGVANDQATGRQEAGGTKMFTGAAGPAVRLPTNIKVAGAALATAVAGWLVV